MASSSVTKSFVMNFIHRLLSSGFTDPERILHGHTAEVEITFTGRLQAGRVVGDEDVGELINPIMEGLKNITILNGTADQDLITNLVKIATVQMFSFDGEPTPCNIAAEIGAVLNRVSKTGSRSWAVSNVTLWIEEEMFSWDVG